jgi:hypothetical protein
VTKPLSCVLYLTPRPCAQVPGLVLRLLMFDRQLLLEGLRAFVDAHSHARQLAQDLRVHAEQRLSARKALWPPTSLNDALTWLAPEAMSQADESMLYWSAPCSTWEDAERIEHLRKPLRWLDEFTVWASGMLPKVKSTFVGGLCAHLDASGCVAGGGDG